MESIRFEREPHQRVPTGRRNTRPKSNKKNTVWTSYFDEGVFGNYGWDNPIRSCGLRSWTNDGQTVYTYNNSGKNFIADCYALNIVNDNEVWFYYYTDFLLARIKNGSIDFFDPKISGADGFLIFDKYVLFRGGYDKQDEYHLLEVINNNKLQDKKKIIFTDENKDVIKADNIDSKGSQIIIRVGTKLYRSDLKDILEIR